METEVSLPSWESPLPVSTLSQMNAVHPPPSCFLNKNFNINLPPTHKPFRWTLPLRICSRLATSCQSHLHCYNHSNFMGGIIRISPMKLGSFWVGLSILKAMGIGAVIMQDIHLKSLFMIRRLMCCIPLLLHEHWYPCLWSFRRSETMSEPRLPTGLCSSAKVMHVFGNHWWYGDAGWGKLLTRPPELSGNPTNRAIWEKVGGMDERSENFTLQAFIFTLASEF
jgi:hypothetical protein